MVEQKQTKLRGLILAAQFAIILAIFAQITIPFGIVSLTGQTLALGLFATIASPWISTSAVAVYLLLGMIGLPVYAGGASGITVLFGPNWGYLFGFLIYTLIVGMLMKLSTSWWNIALSNFIAALVQLFIGAFGIAIWNQLSLMSVIKPAMLVFIPAAIIKIIIVVFVTRILIKKFGIFK